MANSAKIALAFVNNLDFPTPAIKIVNNLQVSMFSIYKYDIVSKLSRKFTNHGDLLSHVSFAFNIDCFGHKFMFENYIVAFTVKE